MTEKRSTDTPFAPALDLDAVRTVRVGTALWALALIVLLPFNQQLADEGRTWWIWTCVAGVVLGLMGAVHTTRRRARRTDPQPKGHPKDQPKP